MKRVLYILFTLVVMLFFASLTRTGETRADGCSITASVGDIPNRRNFVIESSVDGWHHVEFGVNNAATDVEVVNGQGTTWTDYPYDGGEFDVMVSGPASCSMKVAFGKGENSSSSSNDPEPPPPNECWNVGEILISIEGNHVHLESTGAGAMGEGRYKTTVAWRGLEDPDPTHRFNPDFANNGQFSADYDYPLDAPGTYHGVITPLNSSVVCYQWNVVIPGSEEQSSNDVVVLSIGPTEGLPEDAVLQPANGRWYAYFAEGTLRVGMTDGSDNWQVLFQGSPLAGSNPTVDGRGVIGFTNADGSFCETDRVGSFLRGCTA